MALYREGKWPPHAPEDNGKNCASRDDDVDVMRFAGRPGFVSVPEAKESATNTPETTAGGSPPNQAHPLLFEYLKQFQPGSESEAAATFPPEQSMLPPIMLGSDAFEGLNDPYLRDMPSPTLVNDHGSTSPYSSAKLQFTADWASMLPSAEAQSFFGNQIPLAPDFVPMQSNNNEQYIPDTDSFLPANGTLPDYAWDQFLFGLVPQDPQTSEATS
jgi:hypothetical protein